MPVIIEKRIKKTKPKVEAASATGTLRSPDHLLHTVNKDKLAELQSYIISLMDRSLEVLGDGIEREGTTDKSLRTSLVSINREYNGVVTLTEKQKMLDDEWKKGRPTAPPPVNPQVTKAHIENGVAYMAGTLTVDNGIWSGQGNKTTQPLANAIAQRLKMDAELFDHRTALTEAFRSGFIGNLGGVFIDWGDNMNSITSVPLRGDAEQAVVDEQIPHTNPIYGGNILTAADPFNLILDSRVQPSRIFDEGEYAGYIKLVPRIKIYDQFRLGNWYYPEGLPDYNPYKGSQGDNGLYFNPPSCKMDNMFADTITTIYLRVYPKVWGLGDGEALEIWKFKLLGTARNIIDAEPIDSKFLPFVGFCIDPNTAYNSSGGLASQLLPFQRFIAFIFSSYQYSLLKNINGGLTLVRGNAWNLQDMSDTALVGGVIQSNDNGSDTKIDDEIKQLSAPIDLKNVPQDIKLALDLMQTIFPTDTLKQISSLERATQYQAAATVAAGNKRNVLIAGLIDSQMMAPLRQIMTDNILRNVSALNVVDQNDGSLKSTPIEAFNGLDLRYTIADGLAGLDNLGSAEAMQQAINSLLQMPQAAMNFDLFGALNFMLQKRGANIDFTQFRLQPQPVMPQAGMPPIGAPPADATQAGSPAPAPADAEQIALLQAMAAQGGV